MDPEILDGRFLGCSHERVTTPARKMKYLLDNHQLYHPRPAQKGVAYLRERRVPTRMPTNVSTPHRRVELVVYNMERLAKDCINAFCELYGYEETNVGAAPTPFLDESKDPLVVSREPRGSLAGVGDLGRIAPASQGSA